MSTYPTIHLLTLGEELLLGLTANSHLTYIGNELRKRGVTLRSNATISDESDDIAKYFELYWNDCDVLITTGGLGPTVDDRTKEVIAQSIGENLVFDECTMHAIRQRFQRLGLELTENNRKQAFRFSSSEVLPNANGTAPGIWLEKDGKILVMLPGPPHELQPMFEQQVIPRLENHGLLQDSTSYIQIRTTGLGESALETLLDPIADRNQGLEFAFCAHPGMVDFRLAFKNGNPRPEALKNIADECRNLLGENYLSTGDDDLVTIVSKILRSRNQTLTTVESCTGGYLANEITNRSGASDIFRGGFVTYCDEIKNQFVNVSNKLLQKHSAVSHEVAEAMALGAAHEAQADYAISTTGYLGPTGGTEKDPVGTVYVGVKTPHAHFAKRFQFRGERAPMKRRILTAALDLLRRELNAEPSQTEQPV